MAMDVRMIPPGFVEDALECLRRQGIDSGPLLARAGLSDPVTEAVTPVQYGQLWLAMAAATDDEFFGLAAHPMRHGSFALMCQAALHAGSLDKALRRSLRFLRVVLDDPWGKLVVDNGQAQVILTNQGEPRTAFAYRTFWLILHGVACWLIGRRIPLSRVDFACPPPDHRTDYRQFFGAPVRFDQANSRLCFDAEYLALPTIRTETHLRAFLARAPANILVRYRHDTGMAARVRATLRQTTPADWPTLDALATRWRIPTVTLRRRLRAEGQSFQVIKDDIRAVLARALLRDSGRAVADIAADLGYTEPSAFHRAFRKWTGTSPGAFRAGGDEPRLKPTRQ